MQFLDKSKAFSKSSPITNPLLKKLILFLVVTLLLYLGLDALLHYHQIGLTFRTATHSILGNEEEFLDPILFDTLLEHVHADILSAMITLMLLTTILVRLNPNSKQKLVHLSFITAILTQVSLILAPTLPLFISLWVILFISWHLLSLIIGFFVLWKLFK
ncbi:MAG: Unknown protein [uncultured Sulfurovum sp.]|uniref:Uncharacterized protein n=1 Tax=uncultured Sulfurovum sp. TaxID=269237 RepID=A0A6S6TD91_9BACT|nr:MAG: Unknown protein [uncultured Sulfurovum sp.]